MAAEKEVLRNTKIEQWESHHACLRSYHAEHEHLGYPPEPYQDDGIAAFRRERSAGDDGGWAGMRSEYRTDTCTVDRRDWRKLSVEEFHEQYFDTGRPVILFGEGLVELNDGHDWSVDGLKDAYGDVEVFVSTDMTHKVGY
jgi:hypothetical protein